MDVLKMEVCGRQKQSNDPATTSTTPIHQLLGAAVAQTAHPATSSTALAHQPLGSANAENTTSRSAGRSGRQKTAPQCSMRREERVTIQGLVKKQQTDGMSHRTGARIWTGILAGVCLRGQHEVLFTAFWVFQGSRCCGACADGDAPRGWCSVPGQ